MFTDQDTINSVIRSLKIIRDLGGNLPEDRLTSKTGPNDARHRGLMYVAARAQAIAALAVLGVENADDLFKLKSPLTGLVV